MKKINPIWIVLGIVALCIIWGISIHNGQISKQYNVQEQLAQVDNVYQRKYDLIPNLVATVKQYTDYEGTILKEVTDARSRAGQVQLSGDDLSPAKIQEFQAAQAQLSGALTKLLVTVERYPDLKANQNFLELQAELAGSENRIAVERKKSIQTINTYNKSIKRFPGSLIAGLTGKEPIDKLFEAEEDAKGGKVDVDELFDN